MALRFRKRIKILPGVHVNLSKNGVSTSLGPRGATVNIKPGRKSKTTIGAPGTGLSVTENTSDLPIGKIIVAAIILALIYALI
jgi:hypothetical protein